MAKVRLALTPAERKSLRDHHFFKYEVEQLAHAKTGTGQFQKLDLSTEAWQNVIRSRARWYSKFKASGGTDYAFSRVLRDFYARQVTVDQTPFVWLRIEYGRHISAQKTDYKEAKQARATRKQLKGFWWKA